MEKFSPAPRFFYKESSPIKTTKTTERHTLDREFGQATASFVPSNQFEPIKNR